MGPLQASVDALLQFILADKLITCLEIPCSICDFDLLIVAVGYSAAFPHPMLRSQRPFHWGISFLRVSSNTSSVCLQIPFSTHFASFSIVNNDTISALCHWGKLIHFEGPRFPCSVCNDVSRDSSCARSYSSKLIPEDPFELYKEKISLLHRRQASLTNMFSQTKTTLTAVSSTPATSLPFSDMQAASNPREIEEEIIIDDSNTDSPTEKDGKTNSKRKSSFMASHVKVAKRASAKTNVFPYFSSVPSSSSPSTSESFRSSVLEFGPVKALDPIPVSFLTWNINGLLPRIRASQWTQFADYVKEAKPDVICLQEIRLPAFGPAGCRKNDGEPRDRGAVRVELAAAASAAERKEVQTIACALREAVKALPDYRILMSLADWKYSGQFLLLRKHLRVESIRYNLNEEDPSVHHTEGRVIVADFGRFSFLTTYSPNNGWAEGSFQRRRKWDEALLKFVQRSIICDA
ncbi:DNA-(apurinic or apyrimidinic site) lyase, putative [Eimeria maxima]|uniref:DNA-(Apurinic or apyrimidinic site) lyase, putative n=1 Tax=Eimeria maxima TaxID=5804 RepID=U6MED4_EIMMA|nr:DNA-(apurinic or apyrimidinic site) lyase, putative [Eimeria maxima]CDJ60824.1 DNA-(apurinic or apyrimidinic site) lyase, putative [Eimeria maxima]